MKAPTSEPSEMNVIGVISLLKSEADGYLTTGIHWLLESNSEERMKPLTHAYLSSTASATYLDTTGAEFATQNETLLNEQPLAAQFEAATGTAAWQADARSAFTLHCHLIKRLTISSQLASDHMPSIGLDTPSGSVKLGGWTYPYKVINVPAVRFAKPEQDRCIFAMKTPQFKALGGSAGDNLLTSVLAKASSTFKRNVTCSEVHVLFHWNRHSFFVYHQDAVGDIAFIVNLSNCTTSMHVAGSEKVADMSGPGSARFFPTKLFHRSDVAPRRCVKVVFFLTLCDVIEVKSGDEAKPVESVSENGKANEASESTASLSFDLFSESNKPSEAAPAAPAFESEAEVKDEVKEEV